MILKETSKLSEIQEKRILSIIKTKINEFNNNIKVNHRNRKELKEEIKRSYYKKSNSRLRYFLSLENSYNNRTGELYFNHLESNIHKYKDDISIEKNEIIVNEKKAGKFLDNYYKNHNLKKINKIKYLEFHNKDKEKLFITFTLPSKYHYYSDFKKKIKNKKCKFKSFEESVKVGLDLIVQINRDFYKYIKDYLKKSNDDVKFDFIRIIEYHKSLTSHSHSVLYVSKSQAKTIEKVFETIIKKHNLKQVKLEYLKNAKSSSYIYKYLVKNFDDKKDNFFNQYRLYFNKIKVFTSSNFKNTTQKEIDILYQYLAKNKPDLLEQLQKTLDKDTQGKFQKDNYKPIYVSLEEIINKDCTIQYETNENTVLDSQSVENELNTIYHKRKKNSKQTYTTIKKIAKNTIENIGNYQTEKHNIEFVIVKNIYYKFDFKLWNTEIFENHIISNYEQFTNKNNVKRVKEFYFKDELIYTNEDFSAKKKSKEEYIEDLKEDESIEYEDFTIV